MRVPVNALFPWNLFAVLCYPLIVWAVVDFCHHFIAGGILTFIVIFAAIHCLIVRDTWNLSVFVPISIIGFSALCALLPANLRNNQHVAVVFILQIVWHGTMILYSCAWLALAAADVKPFVTGLERRKCVLYRLSFWDVHVGLTMALLFMAIVQIYAGNFLAGVPCLLTAITGIVVWGSSMIRKTLRPDILWTMCLLVLSLSTTICAALALSDLEKAMGQTDPTKLSFIKEDMLPLLPKIQAATYCELFIVCSMLTLQTTILLIAVTVGRTETMPWDRIRAKCEIAIERDPDTERATWKCKLFPARRMKKPTQPTSYREEKPTTCQSPSPPDTCYSPMNAIPQGRVMPALVPPAAGTSQDAHIDQVWYHTSEVTLNCPNSFRCMAGKKSNCTRVWNLLKVIFLNVIF